MKLFKMAAIVGALVFTSFAALASGPEVISSYQVLPVSNDTVKVCITTYSGWGENKPMCSVSTFSNNSVLADIQRMNPESKSLQVGYIRDGFTVESLLASLTVNNCTTTSEAQKAIEQKKMQILQLQKEIRAIEQNATQRTCQ